MFFSPIYFAMHKYLRITSGNKIKTEATHPLLDIFEVFLWKHLQFVFDLLWQKICCMSQISPFPKFATHVPKIPSPGNIRSKFYLRPSKYRERTGGFGIKIARTTGDDNLLWRMTRLEPPLASGQDRMLINSLLCTVGLNFICWYLLGFFDVQPEFFKLIRG